MSGPLYTVYAVVWIDFGTFLSLPAPTAEAAIDRAKRMGERTRAAGITLRGLRAVSLSPYSILTTLWQEV